ncbi:MAG TPA: hypothetical protein DCX53_13930 [Anaerolineae bacterium]|nr:hypothetical protein [Anaerolineae bacterium]
MSPGLKIRAARAEDAAFVALLIYLSMDSLADHLFNQEPGSMQALLEKLVARNAGRFGYKHAFVAEVDGQKAGLLVAVQGVDLNRLALATIPHLIAVLGLTRAIGIIWRTVKLPGEREAENDELYISNIGVLPSMQGQSLGSQLLAYAEGLALEHRLMKCSLIVGWHNTDARRLYERVGYRVVETVKDEKEDHGYYRMVKAL